MSSTLKPPPGTPRFVAMSRDVAGGRTVVAESPARQAVDLALGAMAQTAAARGEEFTADLWGPSDSSPAEWRYDGSTTYGGQTNSAAAGEIAPALTAREQREFDQRMQTLSAALGRAGITAAATEVASVARPLSAASTRQIAQWLDSARQQ
ncbi:hypothetical protein ABZ069_35150 [Streptomyces microflavus]|uniref:hypothetical protein n=1 Tax=Streptomyces microflavus TaxID=1919 RepID=UPI0033A43E8E